MNIIIFCVMNDEKICKSICSILKECGLNNFKSYVYEKDIKNFNKINPNNNNRVIIINNKNDIKYQEFKNDLIKSGNPVIVFENDLLFINNVYKSLLMIGRFLGVGLQLTKYLYIIEEINNKKSLDDEQEIIKNNNSKIVYKKKYKGR